MAIFEEITLRINDGLVVRSLKNINNMIAGINNKKIDVGAKDTAKDLDSASNSSRKFGHALLRFAFSSLVVVRQAMNAFNSGLKDLEEGLKRVIQLDAGFMFKGLAKEIQDASFGFLDLNQAMSFAKGIQGLKGANSELAQSMARLAAIASLTNPTEIKDAEQGFERIQKAFITGQPTKELSSVSKPLYDQLMLINKSIPLWDILGRRMAFAAAIAKVSARESERFAFMLTDPFFRLIEAINKIRNSLKGMGQILTGIGAIALGVLGPLGVGMSAFAFGPVAGIIGTIVGGIISAALATFTVKALNKLSSRDDSLVKLFEKLMFFLKAVFAPLTNVGPNGEQRSQKIIIPEGIFANDEEIKKFALNAVNIGHSINRMADKFKNAGKITFDIIAGEGGIIDAFIAGFDSIITKEFKDFVKQFAPKPITSNISGGDVLKFVAFILGEIAGGISAIVSLLQMFHTWFMNNLKKGIDDLVEGIQSLTSWIQKLPFIGGTQGTTIPMQGFGGGLPQEAMFRLAPPQMIQSNAEMFPNFERTMSEFDKAFEELKANRTGAALTDIPNPGMLHYDPAVMNPADPAMFKQIRAIPSVAEIFRILDDVNANGEETNRLLKNQNDMWRRDQSEGR